MSGGDLLPVHGFALAGGQSSRMGQDKALLRFGGRPMVEIAVEKLRIFCAAVAIAGNRDDLASVAPVVHEQRVLFGPVAGIEAGLLSASQAWALFLPIDVPLVPAVLLRNWAEATLARESEGVRLSFLRACGGRQPAFSLLHRDCLRPVADAAERGERKLGTVFEGIASMLGEGSLWIAEAETFVSETDEQGLDVEAVFANINTPEELSALERSALPWVHPQ